MKFLIALLIVVAGSFAMANRNSVSPDRMPSKFRDFDSTLVIHLYHGGGMHYSSEDVYIRFDSCIRVDMLQGVDKITKFAMTEEMRSKITSILINNNLEYIRQSERSSFAHDKATTSICVEKNGRKDFCISTGSSTEIDAKWKDNFSKLWDELEKFSVDNSK